MNFQRILVPVDFSANSLAGLDAAVELARKVNGSVTMVCVMPQTAMLELGPLVVPPGPARLEVVQRKLADLRKNIPTEVSPDAMTYEGPPWAKICEAAVEGNFDLIVISSHGRTGLKRMLLGSTAEQVVRHATCPVLVVKNSLD